MACLILRFGHPGGGDNQRQNQRPRLVAVVPSFAREGALGSPQSRCDGRRSLRRRGVSGWTVEHAPLTAVRGPRGAEVAFCGDMGLVTLRITTPGGPRGDLCCYVTCHNLGVGLECSCDWRCFRCGVG